MDLIAHIKEEHQEYKNQFAAIEKATGQKKEDLFKDLYASLYGHHEAEEQVLFPLIKEAVKKEDKEIVMEMIEEHSLGTYQFSVVHKTGLDNETWDAKLSVLKEVMEHHMDEEEEEFLPLAEQVLSKEQREQLLETFEKVLEDEKKNKMKEL